MKFKKIFIFALLIATSVLLVACNGGGNKKVGPAIINNSGQQNVTLRVGMEFNPLEGITATDAVAGDVTEDIVLEGSVNVDEPARYELTYKIVGTDGEEFLYKRTITVKEVEFFGFGDRVITVGAYFNPESGVSINDPILGTRQASKEEDKEYFEITGEVDSNVAGDYQIVYKITIGNFTTTIIRTINVVNEATINVPLEGNELEYGATFDPLLGVTAIRPVEAEKPLQKVDEDGELVFDENDKPVYVQKLDEDGEPVVDSEGNPVYESELDEDGNPIIIYRTENVTANIRLTGSVDTETVGEYTLTYKIANPDNPLEFVKDSQGEDVKVTRTVIVYVKVEVRGLSPLTVTEGKGFSNSVEGMEGISGYDSIKGNVTADIQIIGEVNVNKVGIYTLTYILMGSHNITDTKTRQVTVAPVVEGRQEIVFMSGNVLEHNPFLDDFTGTNAAERQALHEMVEEKYNVKIVYKPYPDNAGWGPDRINAIIAGSTAGAPLADVFYHVTTDWLAQLAGGGALAPIDSYIGAGKPGEKIDQKFIDAGALAGSHYGFSTGSLNLEAGLYFNEDLINELGIPNPAELYLGDGTNVGANWRWSDFKAWAVAAQAQLNTKGEDYFALGGAISYYGENLVPLNGGKYLDMLNAEVKFNEDEAMETYDFIHELYLENLFEKNGTYDQGSAEWQAGKVLMHPGDLWFLRADNRWGKLGFKLGFVPYPKSDTYEGEYLSPVYGSSVAYLASGHPADKRELTFKVWNEIQIWESELDPEEAFRLSLARSFNDELYIDAYMTVYLSTYVEFLNSIGVKPYSENSLKLALNKGITSGDYRNSVESIVPVYKTFLGQFVSGN